MRFCFNFYGFSPYLSSLAPGSRRVQDTHKIRKEVGSGAWTPRRRRVRGSEGAGGSAHQSPAWRAAPSLLFLVQRVVSVFGVDLRFSLFLVFADSPQPGFALSNFFFLLFPEHESKHFPNQQRKVRTLAPRPGRAGTAAGSPLPPTLDSTCKQVCVCPYLPPR